MVLLRCESAFVCTHYCTTSPCFCQLLPSPRSDTITKTMISAATPANAIASIISGMAYSLLLHASESGDPRRRSRVLSVPQLGHEASRVIAPDGGILPNAWGGISSACQPRYIQPSKNLQHDSHINRPSRVSPTDKSSIVIPRHPEIDNDQKQHRHQEYHKYRHVSTSFGRLRIAPSGSMSVVSQSTSHQSSNSLPQSDAKNAFSSSCLSQYHKR